MRPFFGIALADGAVDDGKLRLLEGFRPNERDALFNGSTILPMGLPRNEASPVRTEVKGWPASSPDRSLIKVPELPASRMPSGS